jgi:hypothetical protein
MNHRLETAQTVPRPRPIDAGTPPKTTTGESRGSPDYYLNLQWQRTHAADLRTAQPVVVNVDVEAPYFCIWQEYVSGYAYPIGAKLFDLFMWRRPATSQAYDQQLAVLTSRLVALKTTEDEDDWAPSETAYWNAVETISSAYGLLRITFAGYDRLPTPVLSSDGEGTLRSRWVHGDREIRANFAGRPTLRSYLYYESEPSYGTEELNAEILAARLRWLMEDE